MENSNVKYHELSLKELDLATRIIKFIQQHEYDEFWTITQCSEDDLPDLLKLLEAGKGQSESKNEILKMKFDYYQGHTLERAIWYAYNFDDIFVEEFEAELEDICDFYDKLNVRNDQ